MPGAVFAVPLWVELAAAGLGGLQGALFAAAAKDRRIDVLGVMILGIAVALGGSLLRDVILDEPPVVVWSGGYLVVATIAALVGMAVEPYLRHVDRTVLVLDALVIGAFAAIGTTKALALGVGAVGALLVGVVGGVGGSIARDVLLGRPVELLQVGSLFAVAAAIGAGALLALVALGVPVTIAGVVCIVVTAAVRLCAVRFGWRFPEQRSLLRPRSQA